MATTRQQAGTSGESSSSSSGLGGKTVLITGASQGIGRSIAVEFAGATPAPRALILVSRSADRLAGVIGAVQAANPAVRVVPREVDVGGASRGADISGALSSALAEIDDDGDNEKGGGNGGGERAGLDVLVNNAGAAVGAPRGFGDQTLEEIESMVDVNVRGYMRAAHAALNAGGMLRRGKGTILNVTSVTALEVPPFPGEAVYHASKAAQEGFGNALRAELSGTDVRVLSLRPGVVAGTAFHERRVGFAAGRELYDGFMRGYQPLLPGDVAAAARWMVEAPGGARVSVKALDVVPTAQRSLSVFDRGWNERRGAEDVKMEHE